MTHIETARVNELLGLQIGIIKDVAAKLNTDDLERLETDLAEVGKAVKELMGILEGLPHKHP